MENSTEIQSAQLPAEGGLIKIGIFQQTSDALCPQPVPVWMRGYHAESETALWFRLPCRRWTCPVCGPKLASMLIWRASYGAGEVQLMTGALEFVTVTSHERLNAAQSLHVLPLAWNKLNRRIKRATGRTTPYFAVPEQHVDGRWHLHAIVGADLTKRWWKDNARTSGMGYQSDAKELKRAGSVAAYIAKYQTKLLEQNSDLPPHFRRARVAHSWPKLPGLPSPTGWEFTPYNAFPLVEHDKLIDKGADRRVIETDYKTAWEYVEMLT